MLEGDIWKIQSLLQDNLVRIEAQLTVHCSRRLGHLLTSYCFHRLVTCMNNRPRFGFFRCYYDAIFTAMNDS